MDNIFEIGDRVFHYAYGWGTIKDFLRDSIRVDFYDVSNGIKLFERNSIKLLSFTEYTLEGFTQERPEELPKKGDIVWVRQEFPSEWRVGHFFKKEGDKYYVSCSPNVVGWTAEGIELRTNNPYTDEQ
jgi:hypothetical protein